MTGALGLAFVTGMLATVNPCGFAMLPTYLAYFISSGTSDPGGPDTGKGAGPKRPLLAGLWAGVTLSGGFALVFVTAGLLMAVGLRSIAFALPWAAALMGAVIVIAGPGMLLGWQLPGTRVNLNRFLRAAGTGSGLKGVFSYGVAYAVAALSCSLALLLAVVAQAVSTGSLLGLLAVFAAYAAGSSVVLILLSLGAAVARDAVARHVRRLLPYINRLGGVALILAGIYLLLYWVPALSGGRAGGLLSPAVTAASAGLSGFITDTWPVITIAAVLAILAVAVVSLRRRSTTRTRSADTNTSLNPELNGRFDGGSAAAHIIADAGTDACCAPAITDPVIDRSQQQGTP